MSTPYPACNLQAILRLRTAVQAWLARHPQGARDFAWTTTYRPTTLPVGEVPPVFQTQSWAATLARLGQSTAVSRLIRSLDQLLAKGKFPELAPEALWADPEGRQVLRAIQATPEKAEALLVAYLWKKQPELAAALKLPLLGLTFTLPRSQAWEIRPTSSGQVTAVSHLTEKERAALETVLANPADWPRLAQAFQDLTGLTAELTGRASSLQTELENLLGVQPGQFTLAELVARAVASRDRTILEQARTLIQQADLPVIPERATDALALVYGELIRRAQADVRERMAALPHFLPEWLRQLGRPIQNVRRFFREYGLARLSFPLQQVLQDTIVKPFLAGYGKAVPQALLEFRSYYRAWALGLDLNLSPTLLRSAGVVVRTGLDQELARNGITVLPEEITAEFERDLVALELELLRPEASSIFTLPVFGWALRKSRTSRFLPARLPGKGAEQLARFSSWITLLARAQEAATRKAIFATAALGRLWGPELDTFRLQLEELWSRYPGLPLTVDELLERFRSGGVFTPQAIFDLVLTATENRLLAGQVRELWSDRIAAAIRSGVNESLRVNYDFLRQTVGDELLAQVFQYHFWATRNLPFYLEELLRHRAVFLAWLRAKRQAEQEQEEGERPTWAGTMVRAWDGALFGQHLQVYLDLWDLISVTSQLTGEIPGQVASPLEAPLRVGSSYLLSPHWDLRMALWLLGYTWTADPPPPPSLFALPGRMLGGSAWGPVAPFWFALRGKMAGVLPGSHWRAGETISGSASLDRAIWTELVILSLERTGRPDHPRYQAALANPQDPLYQEARDRVLLRLRAEQASSFFSPERIAVVSGDEQELRALQVAAGYAELDRPTRLQLQKAHAPVAWTSFIPRDAREAQIRTAMALRVIGRLSDHPWSDAELAGAFPWYGRYLAWMAKLAPGQDRSVGTFLAETR